ncbi:MAG: hypothetical protein ACOCZ6_03600 [Nanoarchaeota archaeon]
MRSYQITKREAIKLQKWALEVSGVNKLLQSLPKELYLDYTIDESELDGGMDWPDVGVLTVYSVINNQKKYLGELRAYDFETYWLSTEKYEEVDTAENWIELIQKDYRKIKNG